jgi:two-component system response regulator FixJ
MNSSSSPASPANHDRTVFIVDDDPAARQSVAALVSAHGMETETFENGEAFLAYDLSQRRGCIVLDVRMTGITGLDVQAELRRRNVLLPVIVITGFADVPMAVRAMHQGAFTFLEKPCGDQELWRNIEMALDQEQIVANLAARKREIQTNYDTLTDGELAVLEKLLQGDPNKAIAADLDMGLRTVEMRRATILKKMNANSLAELVRLVLTIRDGK